MTSTFRLQQADVVTASRRHPLLSQGRLHPQLLPPRDSGGDLPVDRHLSDTANASRRLVLRSPSRRLRFGEKVEKVGPELRVRVYSCMLFGSSQLLCTQNTDIMRGIESLDKPGDDRYIVTIVWMFKSLTSPLLSQRFFVQIWVKIADETMESGLWIHVCASTLCFYSPIST